MRWSLLRTSWETTREAPPVALVLLRRLGFFNPSGSPVAGAFSLSENPSLLVRRARPAGDAGPTEIFVATLDFAGDGFLKGEVVEF